MDTDCGIFWKAKDRKEKSLIKTNDKSLEKDPRVKHVGLTWLVRRVALLWILVQARPLVLTRLHFSGAHISSGRRGWPGSYHEGNNEVTVVQTVCLKGQCQGLIVTEPVQQWLGAAEMEIFWRTGQTLLFSFLVMTQLLVGERTGALVRTHSKKLLGSNLPPDWRPSVRNWHVIPVWVSSGCSGFLLQAKNMQIGSAHDSKIAHRFECLFASVLTLID